MENQQEIKPEVLSSILLVNAGGQPYVEYNVNGMHDAFAINWEQLNQFQNLWREDLFNFRGQREQMMKEAAAKQDEEATENTPRNDEESEKVSEDVQAEETASEPIHVDLYEEETQ